MNSFIKLINKLLSILLITLLVIQPLSGSITIFQNIEYSTQNKDLEKVKNVAFEYVGHNLYSENSPYPQIQDYVPKTLVHSIIGGTLSELAGGDFSSGAIATAVSHNVAEYLKDKLYSDFDPKNPPFDKNDPQAMQDYVKQQQEIIKGLSSVVSGAVVLATHENVTDKELEIAQSMGESVTENNALAMPIIYGLMALTAYANAPDINDEIKDGLPLALLNPTVDGTITLYEITQDLIDGGIPTEVIIGAIAHKFKIDEATAKKVVDNMSVYVSKRLDDKLQYVGITNDVARRQAEHYRTKGIEIEPILNNLSKSDARALEQTLIELSGLEKNGGTLMNKINSISKTNPDYAQQLERGQELLEIAKKGGKL